MILWANGSPLNCLGEVVEPATLNQFCYPNSYSAELQCKASSLCLRDGVWLGYLPYVLYCSHFAPKGDLGLTLGSVFPCHLFKRGDRVG